MTAEFAMESITEEGLPRAPSRQSQHQQCKKTNHLQAYEVVLTTSFYAVKPRASSPNFRSPLPDASFSSETLKVSSKDVVRAAHSSAPLSAAQPQQAAAANRQPVGFQTPRKSKSPFSLFKRSRSKTLGGEDTKKVPTSLNLQGKGKNNNNQDVDVSASSQQTPAQSPTPQLSFSSSTTSRTTTNHSEPSDQFYADFTPRPELPSNSGRNSSAVGNLALKQSTASANGNSGSNSKPSYSFASMFGTSGRKKSAKP
jgi:hypothetical protein